MCLHDLTYSTQEMGPIFDIIDKLKSEILVEIKGFISDQSEIIRNITIQIIQIQIMNKYITEIQLLLINDR